MPNASHRRPPGKAGPPHSPALRMGVMRVPAAAVLTVFCVTALVTPAGARAQPAAGVGGRYHIVNAIGFCVGVQNRGTSAGLAAEQGTCTHDSSQTWIIRSKQGISGLAYFQLQSARSHLCLGVDHAAGTSGAAIVQVPCGNVTHLTQFWGFKKSDHRVYDGNDHRFVLSVRGGSRQNGAHLVIGHARFPDPTQNWNLKAV